MIWNVLYRVIVFHAQTQLNVTVRSGSSFNRLLIGIHRWVWSLQTWLHCAAAPGAHNAGDFASVRQAVKAMESVYTPNDCRNTWTSRSSPATSGHIASERCARTGATLQGIVEVHQHSLHSTVFACSITKQLPQVSRLSLATLHAIPNLSPILCLYSPYVCPLCQRTSETPLLGFGVAQATLHLDMKMYDESALGMLALMFPNPPRKRHNIHTKMEAFDIASILYLSLHHILYHFIIFHSCSFHVFHFVQKLHLCFRESCRWQKPSGLRSDRFGNSGRKPSHSKNRLFSLAVHGACAAELCQKDGKETYLYRHLWQWNRVNICGIFLYDVCMYINILCNNH